MPLEENVPSVQEIDKFPWASVSKVQLLIIVVLISYIIYTKTGLPELERSQLQKDNKELQNKLLEQNIETIRYERSKRDYERQLQVKQDSLNKLNDKISNDLMPSARKILKDGKNTK